MPDDDWALGQNEIDVRNEARRNAQGRLWADPTPVPIGWYVQVGPHEWEELDRDGSVVARHTTSRPHRTKAS